MNRLYRIFGICLTVLAIIFFVVYAVQHAASLPSINWDLSAISGLALAILLYILVIFSGGLAWHLLIKGLAGTAKIVTSLRIFFIAQFAKYIPGNIAHYIGRVALARSEGYSLSNIVFSMTLEFGLVILSSVLIAIGSLSLKGREIFSQIPQIPPTWAFAILTFVALLLPFLWGLIVIRLRPGPLKRYLGSEEQQLPNPSILVLSLCIYLAGYILLGAVLFIVAQVSFRAGGKDFWVITGVYAIAWLTGYITPGAPAGLGVRDSILVAALSVIYEPGLALGMTIFMRAITTIGDGLGFIIGLILKKKVAPEIPKVTEGQQ